MRSAIRKHFERKVVCRSSHIARQWQHLFQGLFWDEEDLLTVKTLKQIVSPKMPIAAIQRQILPFTSWRRHTCKSDWSYSSSWWADEFQRSLSQIIEIQTYSMTVSLIQCENCPCLELSDTCQNCMWCKHCKAIEHHMLNDYKIDTFLVIWWRYYYL